MQSRGNEDSNGETNTEPMSFQKYFHSLHSCTFMYIYMLVNVYVCENICASVCAGVTYSLRSRIVLVQMLALW